MPHHRADYTRLPNEAVGVVDGALDVAHEVVADGVGGCPGLGGDKADAGQELRARQTTHQADPAAHLPWFPIWLSTGADPTTGPIPMKPSALLPITSLLSILLMTLHVTDDIVRGISPPAAGNVGAVVIFTVWLTGTMALGERRSGTVIMLLGGLFAAAMPVLHMTGARYTAIATSNGGFFFIWTLIAVGTTGTFTALLAARGLWLSWRAPG